LLVGERLVGEAIVIAAGAWYPASDGRRSLAARASSASRRTSLSGDID
jgi:hypothetical protein